MTKPAWTGELALLEARWTDRDGHTAKFQLVTPNEERPNPFKAFTKRRKGRAGTRFYAAMALVDGLKTDEGYDGNVMLAGWADTSTRGYTVTFWVEPPEQGLHPFEGYTRGVSSFMCALVELDEDEAPVDTERRDRVEKATCKHTDVVRRTIHGLTGEYVLHCNDCNTELPDDAFPVCSCDHIMEMECSPERTEALSEGVICRRIGKAKTVKRTRQLSQYAAMLCNNESFLEWICQDEWVKQQVNEHGREKGKELAADWMRHVLDIESRRELDTDEAKADLYHNMIRRPFVEWSEERLTT